MNAKLLFTATLALAFAFAGSLALADESKSLSRADVVAAYQRAVADGTLKKTDYDFDKPDFRGPVRSRDAVIAELSTPAPSVLLGPLKSRTYNPYGSELSRPSTTDRARVRSDVLSAMRDGTLRHTEDQDLPLRGVRRPVDANAPIVAGGPATSANR